MILLIDNFDSFVYNLARYFEELGQDCEVVRNDAISIEGIRKLAPDALVLSPGPCAPENAGVCIDAVRELGGELPVLGVCLGHQSIAEALGAEVVRAERLMHGKVSHVRHTQDGLFAGLPSPFEATRYHSLIVPEDSLGEDLQACAWSEDPDHPAELMGFRHRQWPVWGVQFHPESYLTGHGTTLLKNFLELRPPDAD